MVNRFQGYSESQKALYVRVQRARRMTTGIVVYIYIYVCGPIETGDDDKLITIVLIRVLFSVSVTLSFIMTVENSVAILLYYII